MPMSFLGLTLASDLLAKALMKLSVSMFDILLPSQHLLFVFDAPKMAPHEAGVCASFPEWGSKCCGAASNQWTVSLLRYQEFRELLCGCYNFCPLQARTGIISLITSTASARRSRHASAVDAGHTYLPLGANLRGDLYPFKLLSISSITTTISSADRAGLSATAGSEITNSIVLCWATGLLKSSYRHIWG